MVMAFIQSITVSGDINYQIPVPYRTESDYPNHTIHT